jgi:signal transduction histidine kinase
MQDNRAMTSLRRALIGLAALALVFGAALLPMILTSDHDSHRGAEAALILFGGWGFTGTGLFAWYRRPGNNIGPLMTAGGFSVFLAALGFSNDQVVWTIGSLCGGLFYAIFIHLLLSFPSGRLETRFERWLVWVAYLDTTVVQLAWVVFTDPVKDGCDNCPANPLLVHNSAVAGVVDAGQVIVGIAVIAAMVGILYRRWRKSAPSQRRATGPVLGIGGLAFGLLVVELLIDQLNLAPDVEDPLQISALFILSFVPFAFLVGLMRTRLSRAEAISSVVGKLGADGGRGALRDALAEALGDPGLELAYWVPAQEQFVDALGRPAEIDRGEHGRMATIIEHDGRRVAAVLHDADLEEDRDLVEAVGAAAALTLENERLDAELRATVEELRASRARIVEAGYEQRRRLERDLHDGAQQRLMALGINLRLARDRVGSDPNAAVELLDGSLRELNETTAELRELARGIHPAVLSDRGLEAALNGLAGRSHVPVEVVATPDERLPKSVESAAYFVAAEALTNVARYAEAQRATVSVVRTNGRVEVEVRDDGIGGADPARGSGLRGLADRVAALDGRLEVSSPEGKGTLVRASIPCE